MAVTMFGNMENEDAGETARARQREIRTRWMNEMTSSTLLLKGCFTRPRKVPNRFLVAAVSKISWNIYIMCW